MMRVYRIGFPHSEISGSTLICSYPELIAACHVLLRLSTPRHPPSTLSSLTRILNILQRCLSALPCFSFQRTYWKFQALLQWRRPGSNRRPSPCKGDALPAELLPRNIFQINVLLVGLARVELATSRLSGVRSNQLSYRPCINEIVCD
jgi:hypothetical protein